MIRRGCALAIVVLGCSRPPPAAEAVKPDLVPSSVADASVIDAQKAAVVIDVGVETGPIKPVSCATDKDCGWDDDCFAKLCLGGPKPAATCEESAPKPGSCLCHAGKCTLRRTTVPAIKGCSVDDDCGFEPTSGECRPGLPFGRMGGDGPWCKCASGACTGDWIDPIPCKTSNDCSWLESPRRPAPASKVPRPKPVAKPCSSATWDSVCAAGFCRIVAWKC